MEKKVKEFYEAPATQVVEITQESVVCASPDFNMPFNDYEKGLPFWQAFFVARRGIEPRFKV